MVCLLLNNSYFYFISALIFFEHLIVSSIDTIRGLDEDMWSDLRAVLLERYKGR